MKTISENVEPTEKVTTTGSCPIIVGGCHRSGTSLVRRILNAHSRIYCGPEVKFFRDFYNDYFKDPIRHLRFATTARAVLPEEEVLEVLGGAFIELHKRAAAKHSKARWADKNPENVLYLNQWSQLLGDNWVFVHVVRNPLDTIASMKESKFPLTIPSELDDRIAFYLRYNQSGLEFEKHAPQRYFRLVYDVLVNQPEKAIDELMGWLGESFEPVQVTFNSVTHVLGMEDPKVGETAGVHNTSVDRWKTILTDEESKRISVVCDPFWQQVSGVPLTVA